MWEVGLIGQAQRFWCGAGWARGRGDSYYIGNFFGQFDETVFYLWETVIFAINITGSTFLLTINPIYYILRK